MKLIIPQRSAGFKSEILFFNATKKRHEVVESDIVLGSNIAFILDSHIVYAELDPGLSFSVVEKKSGQTYGPYSYYMAVVSLHLFGKYDGLVKFLRESFVFDSALGAYKFVEGIFEYSRGTYDFTENISTVARRIADRLPEMHEPFEYEFGVQTYFAEGSIEVFLNKLNILFNESNFNQIFVDDDEYYIGRVNRSSGIGCRMNNGRGFFALNFSNRRHGFIFATKRSPVEYIGFVSSGTQESEDIMLQYITSVQEEIITNKAEAGRYIEEYNIEQTELSVAIKTYDVFNQTIAIVFPEDNPRNSLIFCSDEQNGIFIAEFDSFTKRYTFYGESEIAAVSNRYPKVHFYIDSSRLVISDTENFIPSATYADVIINVAGMEGYVDCAKNRMMTREGNVLSVNYAGNLLNYTL